MTTLPATLDEAEALTFARGWIASMREGELGDLGFAPLHPQAGHALVRRLLQIGLENPRQALAILEAARAGWDAADDAIRDVILEHISQGEPVPPLLAEYHAAIVAGQVVAKPQGRKKSTNIVQDICIVVLIIELIERFPDLKPTRSQLESKNRPVKKPSACSITATAMTEAGLHRGTEKAIQEIWRHYSPRILPGYRWQPRNFIAHVPN